MPSWTNHKVTTKSYSAPPKSCRYRQNVAEATRFHWWSGNWWYGTFWASMNTNCVISQRSLSPYSLLTFTPHAWHKALMRRLPLSKQYHVSVSQSLLSTCLCNSWKRLLRLRGGPVFKCLCQDMASVTLAFFHWRNITALLWQRWCFRNFPVQSLCLFMIKQKSLCEHLMAGTHEEHPPD